MFTISFQSQNIHIDNTSPFFFIAGPCAIEGRTQALETASALKEIFTHLKIPFLYKSSFDKANRSSISSFRGVGMEEGLSILADAQGTCSGGQREFVPVLAKAAASIGVAGMFMEVHPDPDRAPCDGPNMIAIRELPVLLEHLQAFDKLAKGI